jgi:hypothetical protein
MMDPPWKSAQQGMTAAIAGEPRDISDVVDQLRGIQRVLDLLPTLCGDNPVADFNKLYTTITMRILECDRTGSNARRSFLNPLGVEFAKRYVDALRMWGDADPATPEAWAVLFRRFDDHDPRSSPCAVAGVNAHVNYDLPFALIATWERLGFMPGSGPEQQEYELIIEVFYDTVRDLSWVYLPIWKQHLGRVHDKFADWDQLLLLELTRDLAWDRARQIWPLQDDAQAVERARSSLDRHTARVGRKLLSPFCGVPH